MKLSRRIAVIAAREAKRFVALAAERAGREADSIRKQRLSFRLLTDSETEAMLGAELLAALSGSAPCGGVGRVSHQ